MNHILFYFENKSQTNCTRNAVQYFCKAVPNAVVYRVSPKKVNTFEKALLGEETG